VIAWYVEVMDVPGLFHFTHSVQPDRDDQRSLVWDLAYDRDGSNIIVACGNRVFVYDALDGGLMHALVGTYMRFGFH
jgi:hypothetical protein